MNTSFYLDINSDNIKRYQKYFLEMLSSTDVDNLTKWSQGLEYDRLQYDKSYENLESILDKAKDNGLIPSNLQVIFEQYIFADVIRREQYKNRWVEKVLNRKDEDFFPDPGVVMGSLINL